MHNYQFVAVLQFSAKKRKDMAGVPKLTDRGGSVWDSRPVCALLIVVPSRLQRRRLSLNLDLAGSEWVSVSSYIIDHEQSPFLCATSAASIHCALLLFLSRFQNKIMGSGCGVCPFLFPYLSTWRKRFALRSSTRRRAALVFCPSRECKMDLR